MQVFEANRGRNRAVLALVGAAGTAFALSFGLGCGTA